MGARGPFDSDQPSPSTPHQRLNLSSRPWGGVSILSRCHRHRFGFAPVTIL